MAQSRMLKSLATLALTICTGAAQAQSLPDQPITLIVPHSAGGTSDILARTVAAEVSNVLKRTIVVENKGGANGGIAARTVSSAKPDGTTLLLATASTHGINPTLYPSLGYDPVKDFTPVTLLATVPNVLVVGKTLNAASLSELTQTIQTAPNKYNMASAGAGTPGHLAGEIYRHRIDGKFTHVPYKGGSPALTDLIGGQVDFMFTTIPGALPHIKAGTIRPLAVTSLQRSPALPDVPTLDEAGLKGFQAVSWHGIIAPAGTPAPIVAELDKAFTQALAAPEVKQRLLEEGAQTADLHKADFGKFISDEIANWSEAIKLSGASLN